MGEKFLLVCEGPAAQIAKDKVSLEVPKEAKYFLKILSTRELSDSRAEFIATSWTAGELKLENPVLTDGTHRIGLGPFKMTVASVIYQKQNPESKPFPPWGPMAVPWPSWVWLSIFLAVFAVIGLIALRFKRTLKRKRLLRLLESHPIATKPYFQFTKDLRRLSRELPTNEAEWNDEKAKVYFNDLDQALRWYLARELWLPAFNSRPSEIVRELKNKDERIHKAVRRDLVIALRELEKASIQKKVSVQDAQQILEISRGVADHIHKLREV